MGYLCVVNAVIIVAAVFLFIHFNVKAQYLDSEEYRAMSEEYLTNRRSVNALFSFVWPQGNATSQPQQQPAEAQTQPQEAEPTQQIEGTVQGGTTS